MNFLRFICCSDATKGSLVASWVELGFALLEEGADTFAAVFRLEALHLLLDFGFEGLLQRVALVGKQDVLDGLNGEMRTVGKLPRERPRGC